MRHGGLKARGATWELNMRSIILSGLFVLITCGGAAWAENWAGFRGPEARGVSHDADLPDTWSADQNIVWKIKVPGRAWSSPIIWCDRVFITTAVTYTDVEAPKKGLYFGGNRPEPHDAVYTWEVHCYALADGKQLWRKVSHTAKPKSAVHVKNTYASETPATDGKHVYAFFGSAGLYCYDMDGNEVWKKDLGVLHTRYAWGTASSPILHDNKLIVQCDNEGQSFVAAFDKADGKELWRVDRNGGSSWATPYIWKHEGRTELITCATEAVRSYDPDTGKELWWLTGMSSIVITTPFTDSGLLYINSGYVGDRTRPIYAIRPGAAGDISLENRATSNEYVAWSSSNIGTYNPTPVLFDGRLYVLYDRGIMGCFDAKTGKEIYRERLTGGTGQFTTSPWVMGGKVYCANEDGDTWVIEPGDDLKVLRINRLDDMFMACPAISNGSLVLRGTEYLYCIRK